MSALVVGQGVERFEIGLASATDAGAYLAGLRTALGKEPAEARSRAGSTDRRAVIVMLGLAGTLTLLLAALGVFNTALLNTRERIH